MDNKFQRPNKSALTNAQYFSFMTAFAEQLQSAAFTATAIQKRLRRFSPLHYSRPPMGGGL